MLCNVKLFWFFFKNSSKFRIPPAKHAAAPPCSLLCMLAPSSASPEVASWSAWWAAWSAMPSCRKCMFPQYLWRGIGPNIGWSKDRAVAKGSADISSKVDQGWVKVPKQLQRSKVDPSFGPGEYLLLLKNNAPATCSTTRTRPPRWRCTWENKKLFKHDLIWTGRCAWDTPCS